MANPFNVLNPNSPMGAYASNMGNIQNAYRTFMASRNPMQAFNQMAMQNPKMQGIMQALNSGADPRQLYYSMCKQRGIDPQDFLRNITGNSGR